MKRLWLIAAGVTIVITVILEIVSRHHGHAAFWWHATPAFDLLYGLAGCVGIVLVSKWLGHAWLQRREDYYGDDQS
jgi:membrane protein implicated in regulation of membrane protease activity